MKVNHDSITILAYANASDARRLRFRLHSESLGLVAGTINQRLTAVRRLAYEAADSGLLSPELAAGIRRIKGVIGRGSMSALPWIPPIEKAISR